ncbi:MAG: choice-of-anchor G family protein [Actinomycetes bacterium]
MTSLSRTVRGRIAAAGVAAFTAVVVAVTWSSVTDAAWVSNEWVHAGDLDGQAGMRTVDCAAPDGAYATRGNGRVLSGSALGIDLDTLAQVTGVETTNDGSRAQVSPGTATDSGEDGYSNPLNVVVLQALELDLTEVLQLPLDNSTGVLGQYGQAQSTGLSSAGAGFVDGTGAISVKPGGGYPQLGTLRLSSLLDSLGYDLGTVLSGVADVSLEIGAVAGRASLDGCDYMWGADIEDVLDREYLAAGLVTEIDSPTVGTLSQTVSGLVTTLNGAVAGLVGNGGVASELLTGLLGVVDLGVVSTSQSEITGATIDLTAVSDLATATRSDEAGAVAVNFGEGTIRIDTAALLARAYPDEYGNGLNGLDPNTNILDDPAVVEELSEALTEVLADWVDAVDDAVQAALDGLRIEAQLVVSVVLLPTVNIAIDASLDELEAGDGINATGGLVLSGLVNGATGLIGPVLAGIIRGALPAVSATLSELDLAVDPLVEVVADVYSALFLDGIVAVTVNAQNDPSTGDAEPADWAGLPDGRYDVAALRIGVLDALGDADVRLYLGRASVGMTCSIATAEQECAGY